MLRTSFRALCLLNARENGKTSFLRFCSNVNPDGIVEVKSCKLNKLCVLMKDLQENILSLGLNVTDRKEGQNDEV